MEPDSIEPLTQREHEILQLLNARLSNEEIAAVLHLSPGTIKKHVASVYWKLRIRTRDSAVN